MWTPVIDKELCCHFAAFDVVVKENARETTG
jgi:hypothetical protein